MNLFDRAIRTETPLYADDAVSLTPIRREGYNPELAYDAAYTLRMSPRFSMLTAGEISLRVGESDALYYFGHIGYHVDAPFRGSGFAWRSCLLIAPLIRELGMRSVVITTDIDNIPSRRTCEKLGCVLESIAPVPEQFRRQFGLKSHKCRYLWLLS